MSTYLPKSTSFVPAGTDLGVKLFNKYKEGIDKRYKDTIVRMLEKKNSNDATTASTIEDTVSNCGVLFKI